MRSSHRAPRDFSLQANQKPAGNRASFRLHNSVLTLHVDSRPQVPLALDVLPATPVSEIRECTAGGARLFRLRKVDLGWTGPKRSEFAELEARVEALLTNAPEAVFLLEVDVEAPEWWRHGHKAECAVYCISRVRAEQTAVREGKSEEKREDKRENKSVADGEERIEAVRATAEMSAGDIPECASRASRLWLLEAGDALARLAQYVEAARWSDRCIGFCIAGGENGSWRHPDWARLPDIGPRMAEKFRSFCLDKYRRNGGLLKQAWDDPRADFDRIKCPDAYERRYADVGNLRDPLRSRRMLDYYECFYTAQNEAALHFCAIAKRAGGERLVGLAYASLLGSPTNAEGSWGLPESVFDSENVDYLVASPPDSQAMTVSACLGSLKLRDKFVFVTGRSPETVLADAGMAQTVSSGFLAPAAISRTSVETLLKLGERGLNAPASGNKRTAQVALIVDAFGATYVAGKDDERAEWQRALLVEQWRELCDSGALMNAYLLSDLFHPKFSDHKVTVVLNALYLSEAERRKIEARVKRGQQTAIWFWGTGVLSETGVDAEAAGRLIGMKQRLEKNATSLRTRIVEGNDPLTWGLHVGATFGPERAVVPTLTIGDKTITRLGANSANKTTFAVRRNDNWTSIHYGTAPVPAALLRNALRAAGIHLYADGTQSETTVNANARLVVVTSRRGGNVKVFLPGVHEIMEARANTSVTVGSEISLTLAPGETRLLELKPVLSRTEEGKSTDGKATDGKSAAKLKS